VGIRSSELVGIMAATEIDLMKFTKQAGSVALVRAGRDLFGLLTRSVDLPPGWAALVTRQVGDAIYVRPGAQVGHDDVADVLFVRTTPLDLEFTIEGLTSSDGYQCTAHGRVQVELVTEPVELKSFRETVMGSHEAAEIDTLQRHLSQPVQRGLSEFTGERTAAVIVEGDDREALEAALDEKLKPVLFKSGLARGSMLRVAFESPGYEKVRETQAVEARRRDQFAEREQLRGAVREAQEQQVSHLSGLLGQLQQLSDKSPDLSLADLVRTFSERERGELYQALWQAMPEQCARWVVVAAGEELLFFDPSSWERPVRRVSLTSEAGPLRSVTAAKDENGKDVLLVGAARGAHVLEPEAGTPRATYLFDPPEGERLRTGVNAVAIGGGRVFATHSQMGLVVWPIDEPNAFTRMLRELIDDAKTVRCAAVVGDRLWFTADDRVIHVPLDSVSASAAGQLSGSASRITALTVLANEVCAGNEDGQILRWSLDAEGEPKPEILRSASGRAVESVEMLLAGGVPRILFANESTGLNAQVVGDSYICRYDGKEQRVRRAAVAGDWLVAMNGNRDRLLYWRPHELEAPSATVNVGRLTGRSIQDLCIVMGAATPADANA